MRFMHQYLFYILLASSTLFAQNENDPVAQEQKYISHVQQSVDNAWKHISKLNHQVLEIPGMSSQKVRHFLNNLCSMDGVNFLEIGSWKGSTFVSSLYRNASSIQSAIAIDTFQGGADSEQAFLSNCAKFVDSKHMVIKSDCFKTDLKVFTSPVNVYFYDAEHRAEDQELAFTYFDSIFDDVFIAVIDDWNWPPVQEGTYKAFSKLNYTILYEVILPARFNGDLDNWWNGLYVGVIRKPRS
jgi:Methyltransferase domain